tara:strand:+ start:2846 stop:3055 length:210 start_codon:yes stop_codon:yes gene_type:complete
VIFAGVAELVDAVGLNPAETLLFRVSSSLTLGTKKNSSNILKNSDTFLRIILRKNFLYIINFNKILGGS